MKYLVASDIHGSSYYCDRMLQVFKNEKCDKIILLGDLLYHGPRNDLPQGHGPKLATEQLNDYKDKIIAVRGNCDAEIDQTVLEFDISEKYKIIEDAGKKLFLTHGHHYGPYHLPPIDTGDVMFFGHYHVPEDYEEEDIRLINPGSTSLPKGGSCPSCITYEEGKVKWFNLDTLEEYNLK